MKNIPVFKTTNGKYIYGNRYVTELTNAVYADKESITVDGIDVQILSSVRNEEEWIVIVEVDND